MTSNDDYVLEILREKGAITGQQIQTAGPMAAEEGVSVVDCLIRHDVISESAVLTVLAGQLGMELVSLKSLELEPAVLEMIPTEVVHRYGIVPVYKTEDSLTVALSDPLAFDTLDSLRYMLKCNVDGVIASRSEIKAMIDKFYPLDASVDGMLMDQLKDGDVGMGVPGGDDGGGDETVTDADAPIIKLVQAIIYEACKNRATDIHLEPMEKRFRIRFRIDGVLQEVEGPQKRLQSAIINRIKISANMKISEKRIPQDGRIPIKIDGRDLDLRVSTIPTTHGEGIVMRILDKQNLAMGLAKLGFFADDQQTFENVINMSDGIVLVTGPTGSGKTTTLYACLHEINKPDRKIITVEDPVEYQMNGINQVHVREDIGLNFSAALRSILRQAPNIVMIGEIRDRETANIAVEASLTGHLVFSTLHTNDAPSAITRLLDIGVKPFMVASSLRVVMAQRLVRLICPECKESYRPTRGELDLLGPGFEQMGAQELYRGRGCTNCNLTGYRGRKGVFEIFEVTDEMRHMIFEKVSAYKLRNLARHNGMRTLREDGLRKAAAGVTTLAEVVSVTMGDAN